MPLSHLRRSARMPPPHPARVPHRMAQPADVVAFSKCAVRACPKKEHRQRQRQRQHKASRHQGKQTKRPVSASPHQVYHRVSSDCYVCMVVHDICLLQHIPGIRHFGHFSHSEHFFVGWIGFTYIWRERTDCEKPNPTKFSGNTLFI